MLWVERECRVIKGIPYPQDRGQRIVLVFGDSRGLRSVRGIYVEPAAWRRRS